MNNNSTSISCDEDVSPDEVAPGVFRLKIPVPFRGLRYVNLWLLNDGDGFTMIDCGWSIAIGRRCLVGGRLRA